MTIALAAAVVDRQEDARLITAVHEMMSVRQIFRESRAIARPQNRLAVLLDQHGLALKHHDKFIEALVPVPLRRPGARLEDDMTDTDFRQSAGCSKPAIAAAGNILVIWRRVAGGVGLRDRSEVDLGHGHFLC